jgi:hypothetical protein
VTSLAFRITGSSTTAYLDDVKWEPNTTCVEPTALVATSITTTSAQIDWTEPVVPAANGYEFFRSTSLTTPLSSATPTGNVGAGLNSTVMTGLVPSTLYYVWVRSRCSASDRSPWSSTLTFLTNCTDVTTFSQNFDAALSFPTCWKKLGAGGTGAIVAHTAAVSLPNALSLSSTGTTVPLQGLVIMPPVSNAGAGTHRLVFRARARSTSTVGGIIQVGYVTDNFDGNTFVSVQTFTTTSITTFDSFSAILGNAPGANKFLAFRHAGAPANAVLIDNVSWEAIPNCIEPAAVNLSLITSNSATISWTEPLVPAGLGYEYFLATTNTAPTAASIATGSVGTGISTLNLTALVSQTTHFVWVRSTCTLSDRSAWTPSITFTTLCAPFTTLNQDFSTFPPACFNFAAAGTVATGPTGTATGSWIADGFLNAGTTGAIKANLFSNTMSSWIISPVMNLTAANYTFSFKYAVTIWNGTAVSAMGSDDSVSVLISTNGGTTWSELTTFNATSNIQNTSTTYTYNVPPASATANVRFALLASDGTVDDTQDYDFFVDDFKVEVTPTCFEPTALVASAITTTAATISWTAPTVAPANGYSYFLSTTNTAPSAASVATGSTAAGVTTVNLTGLPSATNHFIWVRSVCTPSDSSVWTLSLAFTTLCSPVTTFTQNFDGGLTLPTCWGKVGTPGTAIVLASAAASTPNCLAINSTSALLRAVVSMPPVSNLAAGTHWLKFKARSRTTVGGIIEVGYLTNGSDAASFVSLQSFTTTSTTVYNNFTSFLGTSPVANSILAFRHSGVPANEVLIDDVLWEALPACSEPTGLVVSNVIATSATVSWTASASLPASGYEYFLSTVNTTPLAASVATGNTAAGIVTINVSPLLASTTYFMWVRSACSASISSIWSSSISFTTPCAAEPVPTVLQTVESTTGTNLPVCWSAQLITGTTNWIGYTPSGTFDENSTPVSGTRIFRKTWTNSDAVLFSNALSYVGVTLPTRVSLFLQRNTSADVSDQYKVFVNTTASLTGATQILTVSLLNTVAPAVADKGFYPYTANIPVSFHGQANVFVMIQGTTAGGSASYSLGIDDFKVETIPSCVPPTVLVASAITTTSATVSWTAPITAPANGYQYFLSNSNTAPAAASVATGSTVAGVTTVNLTPLLSATTYFIWVRSVCSASSSSSWSTALSFATACAPASMPYLENFESAVAPNLPNCSSSINSGLGNNWTVAANPGAGFTSNTLKYGWNSANDANTWFFTRAMNLTAGVQYKLNYRYGNNSATYVEKMKVAYGTAATVVGMTNPLADHTAINSGAPVTAPQVTFTPATTGVYFFGFHAYSVANQFDLYVDDIVIDTVLSNNTFDNSSFSYYPNPVKGILTLDYNQNISNVAVFNLLGQQVITKTVNANQSKIDMSNLSAGTYLVKVTADNQTKTIKIIKE